MPRNSSSNRLLAGLVAVGLSVPVLAQSVPFPTYQVGQNKTASHGPDYPSTLPAPWVVSDGQIITPAGTQVYLGITTRAKAVALNPTGNDTAAVLQMGAPQPVTIFNTRTGAVLQTFTAAAAAGGSEAGIAYSPDGKYLLFSQDGSYGPSYVAIASVSAGGLLSNYIKVGVPLDVNAAGYLTTVKCFPNSPSGTTGSSAIPCGQTVSLTGNGAPTSYPLGIAVSKDGKTAYAVLDNNDTLTKIDLSQPTPVQVKEIRVGNVPQSVILSPDGETAYVSNEAGRIATEHDFQEYSNGTPVVAAKNGATSTGTVSVVNLAKFEVTGTIETGLHPTGMAFWGKKLLVANTYSDTLSVIDTSNNLEERKIDLALPIGVPDEKKAAYGAGPDSIAVDTKRERAYVALYNANSIAVVNLRAYAEKAIIGYIPVGYAPTSIVFDETHQRLIVANDKGIGTTGYGVAAPPASSPENSYASHYGVSDLNSHEDLGTVSIIPVPHEEKLEQYTRQVEKNNHWDLLENIFTASGGDRDDKPVAIPRKIGAPSKIKHVFVIIRENRTYDQILGDVIGGNGDPTLAVFGDGTAAAAYTGYKITPNAHALVQRFPLLDNFYDPSRQSADGHNWIVQAMAPYHDDIQAPDFLRDYPSNGGDAIAYQKKGFLWDAARKQGVSFKNYGEYIEYNTFKTPTGSTVEPLWIDFYHDTLAYETGAESQLYNIHTVASHTPLPTLLKSTIQNYPQFDLGIPDQFRFDVWNQDFQTDIAAGTVPKLEFMWISSDHTGGPPAPYAMQADNDLALGRFVDAISHSAIWKDSAIFVEEDDAQNGVDHVDGHRSPGYVISPYVKQQVYGDGTGAGAVADSTFYTQVNMTRTIEQILGLTPMNQFDLLASPMSEIFIDQPPVENFLPWMHVPNDVPLDLGVKQTPTQPIPTPNGVSAIQPHTIAPDSAVAKALRVGWTKKKAQVFAGKQHLPDSEDPDTVNHLIWYETTGFVRPYPGEKTVRSASDFNRKAPTKSDVDD